MPTTTKDEAARTPGQAEAMLAAFDRFTIRSLSRDIEPRDDDTWAVIDTKTADPETNWPGELVSEHSTYGEARVAFMNAILAACSSPAPASPGVPDSLRALSEAVASARAEKKRTSDIYHAAARRADDTFEDLTEVFEDFARAHNKHRRAKKALVDECLALTATSPASPEEPGEVGQLQRIGHAVRSVVRSAWSLCDLTEDGGEPGQDIPPIAWKRLADDIAALEVLIPADEQPASAGHAVTLLLKALATHPAGQSAGSGAEGIELDGDPGSNLAPWLLSSSDEEVIEQLMRRSAGDVACLFFPAPHNVVDPIRRTYHTGRPPRQQRLLAELLRRLKPAPDSTRTGDEGSVSVPVEPTEEMWGGLARQIVMWHRGSRPTGANLHRDLKNCGWPIPDWLKDEIEDADYVPPKGAVAVAIYRAMIAARPAGQSAGSGAEDPCAWAGGNDTCYCRTCGEEYRYGREDKPACPKKPAPDSTRTGQPPTELDITQAMIQAGRHAANLNDGTLASIYLAMRTVEWEEAQAGDQGNPPVSSGKALTGKAQGSWRPIAEAKHDGTVYLLGFYDGPEKTDEHWCSVEGWYETGINDRCWYDVFNERVEPAYFRERIAPPASSGQGVR